MQRISIMLAATALGLSLSAAPAFAVEYIVGEPYCTPEAVNFIEERDGDRYHWCLAEKPAPFQQGIYSADVTSTGPTTLPGKPAAPAPVTPPASIPATPLFPATPVTPPSVPATPLFPATPITPPSVPATPLFPATPTTPTTPEPNPHPACSTPNPPHFC